MTFHLSAAAAGVGVSYGVTSAHNAAAPVVVAGGALDLKKAETKAPLSALQKKVCCMISIPGSN